MTQPSQQLTIDQALELATRHHLENRFQPAEAMYRQILGVQPNHPEALHRMGILALQLGHADMALELVTRAIAVRPQMPEAYLDLGITLRSLNRPDEAIAAYRRAISLKPDFAAAYVNLGHALLADGEFVESEQSQRKALEFDPVLPEAHSGLGHALLAQNHAEAAVAAYRRALELRPGFSEARNNLGVAMQHLGRLDEAAETFRAGIGMDSDPRLHFNLGITYLLQGRLREGWPEYEWRWKVREHAAQQFSQPQWNGEELRGRRILLHAEQGFGDTIQFARYIPLVAQRGGRIVLQCPPELNRLLKRIEGIEHVVSQGSLPPFDVHCRLLSLPKVFDTSLENIPPAPYLAADPERARNWSAQLQKDAPHHLKIGLSWAGRAEYKLDTRRSIPLEMLQPLAEMDSVRVYSLQKTQAASAKIASSNFPMTDWTADLTDFDDTAALIENLDLIISVDTAVAHLAGAMGKPVWVLIPFVPDWRWMRDRTDSPWYSTMRLFRQMNFTDWQSPIEQIVQALRTFKMPSK